jgi:two-component system phosphate regulon response regulator PhoB
MAKIMIVDDDLQAASLVERVVKMFGHQPVVVTKSGLAMETAHTVEPELFILDLMMPEINGFELCTLLRADPQFANSPVIVVSAMEDKDSKAKASSLGVNEYMTKPFDIVELGDKIAALLAQHKTTSG